MSINPFVGTNLRRPSEGNLQITELRRKDGFDRTLTITTHDPKLQRGLVVEDKAERVAYYTNNLNKEVDMIAHACGVRHARLLRREHVRIVQPNGQSMALNMLYPYPVPSSSPDSASH